MGRKLDRLLRRDFRTAKFKSLLNLAISRLAVLKNQKQIRCSHARSDVGQLLELGQQERALLRVEQVIKEQNTFDAFVMVEGYCDLLIERVSLIENQKECPEELKEAISGLIFANSRYGDFPELHQVREMFTSRYGKEFAAGAVELRNHCGVNPKIIQKMSTRHPSLENKLKVLKEIASEKGIALDIDEHFSIIIEEDLSMKRRTENRVQPNRSDKRGNADNSIIGGKEEDSHIITESDRSGELSGSMKTRKYADVASAAQAAFESAAHAAAAARAAVELSRADSHDKGSDDESSRGSGRRNRSYESRDDGSLRSRSGLGKTPTGIIAATEKVEPTTGGSKFEMVHPIQYPNSESEDENFLVRQGNNSHPEEFVNDPTAKLEKSTSASSLDSTGDASDVPNILNEQGKTESIEKKTINFDESDEETEFNLSPRTSYGLPNTRRAGYGFELNSKFNEVSDDEPSVENRGFEQTPIRSRAYFANKKHEELSKMGSEFADNHSPVANYAKEQPIRGRLYSAEKMQFQRSMEKPVSVRTRRVF